MNRIKPFITVRRLSRAALLLLLSWLLVSSTRPAVAYSPYTTWAWGPSGYFIITQDAYRPYAEMDLPIEGAEDMVVTPDGTLYIADTAGGQILKLQDFEVVATYGKGTLEAPSGLFVDEEGVMYVADSKKDNIFILDPDGNVLKQFGRPSEPLFGKNREFLPRKIAVDARKNLYIISEGSVNGIVQMNANGNFIGYFGANSSSMSLKMILQRLFLTEEQLDQFIKNEAASPSNIAIDKQGLVYTITAGTTPEESIRQFTISGKNIFPKALSSNTLRDIDVSNDGLILAVDADGMMLEYDLNGNLLFLFGTLDNEGGQRLGLLRNPTAITRYQDFIYVLDKEKNAVVVYQTTAFAKNIHDGVRLYVDGFYSEAKPYFEEVLNYNGSFIMSYQAIADAYFKNGDYWQALSAYRYAEDKSGYSQAFWELRNLVLQRYLGQAIMGFFALSVVFSVGGRLEKRFRWLDPARRWLINLQNHRLIDDFVFMFRFIKQPADSFYYIKKNQRGSLPFALIIYAWVIIVHIANQYLTGFVFSRYRSWTQIRVENELVFVIGLLALWNAANYLVSTISDGEGRVRDVVIGTAYSLFPFALFALPVALVSNVLTENEVFLYSFSMNIIWFWVGMMLFIMVKEVHNYSFSETVRNILITLFTMGLFLLTGYILYVLFNQLYEFIMAIIQEVGLRG